MTSASLNIVRYIMIYHLCPLVLVSDLVLEQAGQADTPPAHIVLPGRVGHRPGADEGQQRRKD